MHDETRCSSFSTIGIVSLLGWEGAKRDGVWALPRKLFYLPLRMGLSGVCLYVSVGLSVCFCREVHVKIYHNFCKYRLPPVPDFTVCPRFAPCCPASRQDLPRDAKCTGFQGAVKMTTTIIRTMVIIGVIVLI